SRRASHATCGPSPPVRSKTSSWCCAPPRGPPETDMKISFLKMHGAANDFVVIDHRRPFLPSDPGALVRALCDRRRGVGGEGVLLLEAAQGLDFTMRYWNSDGRPAEFCGNGARCLARYALELGLGREGRVRFATEAGVMEARQGPRRSVIELEFGHVEAP